jgi:hypothetical protein
MVLHMKALMITPGDKKWTVSLKETDMKADTVASEMARTVPRAQYFEKAVSTLSHAANWPEWFASNILRWRARHGLVLASAVRR